MHMRCRAAVAIKDAGLPQSMLRSLVTNTAQRWHIAASGVLALPRSCLYAYKLSHLESAIQASSSFRTFHTASFRAARRPVVVQAAKKNPDELVKRIGRDDVNLSFARSGGAGGQNVNKVNTKVDMRIEIDKVSWLEEDAKDALKRREKNRINKEGELVITSTRSRSQAGNVDDALEKLQAAIDGAVESIQPVEVDPEKEKQLKKQVKIANENRIQGKKMKSEKKQQRRAKIDW